MRSPTSHKGENGTVAVIGGSLHQHGAPLMAALAAEASGADLVFVWMPEMHAEVARMTSLNFQVHTFGSATSDEISTKDRTRIIEFLATIDAAVIGPGLSRSESSLKSILELLEEAPCPLVIDASALQQETLKVVRGKHTILTPHLGELERMNVEKSDLPSVAKETKSTFLVKAPIDTVVSEKGIVQEVKGGNPGLTVGGTGDALAGLTAGLIAQGMDHADACVLASSTIKRAGDLLERDHGYAYTTREVIRILPRLLRRTV